MNIINDVPLRTNMGTFYVDNNILIAKIIYSYNIGFFIYEYMNNMNPGVFDNLFSNISDTY